MTSLGAEDDPVARAHAWAGEFAARLGVEPPDPGTVDRLLELASVAAHNSERPAAPLACWLAGVAGVNPAEAARIATEIHADGH